MEEDKSRRVYVGNGEWVYHGFKTLAMMLQDEEEEGVECECIISIPESVDKENKESGARSNVFYICQNEYCGKDIDEKDKFGYEYSWYVSVNSDKDDHNNYGEIESKDTKYVVGCSLLEYTPVSCNICDIMINSIKLYIPSEEEHLPDDWIPSKKDLEFFSFLG
jgi:hypothetical protein